MYVEVYRIHTIYIHYQSHHIYLKITNTPKNHTSFILQHLYINQYSTTQPAPTDVKNAMF
jgi:hypothetical protein